MEVGGPGLIRNFFVGKSSQYSPKPVGLLIFWSSRPIPCVLCLYTLLKVVGYYDLSVLPMSVKSSIQVCCVCLDFLLCKAPKP